MTENPRYRVWRQCFGADGLDEPSAGPWVSRGTARQIRDAAFRRADVARTWIEKEGVPAEHVDATPFIVGEPVSADAAQGSEAPP